MEEEGRFLEMCFSFYSMLGPSERTRASKNSCQRIPINRAPPPLPFSPFAWVSLLHFKSMRMKDALIFRDEIDKNYNERLDGENFLSNYKQTLIFIF